VTPVAGAGRAWWCCTMHGLRSLRDVLDAAVTQGEQCVNVNLFVDVLWADGARKIAVEARANPDGTLCTAITIDEAPEEGVKIAARKPAWARKVAARVNRRTSTALERDGYLTFDRAFKSGDHIELICGPRCEIVKRDGTRLAPEQLTSQPVEAALLMGPWLMGVDEADDPMFFGEPWGGNQVMLSRQVRTEAATNGAFSKGHLHVPCEYIHEGFPGTHELVLRPISERTGHDPVTFTVWLKYSRKP